MTRRVGGDSQARKRRARVWRARLVALASLLAVAAIVIVAVLRNYVGIGLDVQPSTGRRHPPEQAATDSRVPPRAAKPGTPPSQILTYHVINVAPASTSASPSLYVPADEFTSQMTRSSQAAGTR